MKYNSTILSLKARLRAFFILQARGHCQTNGPNYRFVRKAARPSKTTYWRAFHACRKKQFKKAHTFLEKHFFREGWIDKNNSRLHLYEDRISFGYNSIDERSWLDLCVIANDQLALVKLARRSKAKRIEIMDACLTFDRRITPLHLIMPSEADWLALLKLYEIEAQLLCGRVDVDQKMQMWIRARNERARDLFRTQQNDRLCQDVLTQAS